LELAIDEARHLGHNYIGTEHLLLVFLHEGGGVAPVFWTVLALLRTGTQRKRLKY